MFGSELNRAGGAPKYHAREIRTSVGNAIVSRETSRQRVEGQRLNGSIRPATAAFVGGATASSGRLQLAPSLRPQSVSEAMRTANPYARLQGIDRVAELHRAGRLAVAIIHGNPDKYFSCMRPAAVLESERLTSLETPVPVKSTTLLPSSQVPNARVSLYTRVAGPWAQAGYGTGPEKKVFFAFDASTAESFTDGDAMTVYGYDKDGIVDYNAAQPHTQMLNDAQALDACIGDYTWSGRLNELLVRMNDVSLVGMGVIHGAHMTAGASDFEALGKMASAYWDATGSPISLLVYDLYENKLDSIDAGTLKEKITDVSLQQRLMQMAEKPSATYQALSVDIKLALETLQETFAGQQIDLSQSMLDKAGNVVPLTEWGESAQTLNRHYLVEQVLQSLARSGIKRNSVNFESAYYRLMLRCHIAIRLQVGAQQLARAEDDSTPLLIEPLKKDLALLAVLQNPEAIKPDPRVLLRLLPQTLRSPALCKQALEKGAPLKMVPTHFDLNTYVDLIAPVLNRSPQRFKELPDGLAGEKPEYYLEIIKRIDRLDAGALDKAAPCYLKALTLTLAKNPKAIREVEPGKDVTIDRYKRMASAAYAADHEAYDRIRWRTLAFHDEAFCLPIWRQATLEKPENIRKIPESSKEAIVDIARLLLRASPKSVAVLWPQFWRPNVDRATFEMLLSEAQSLDPDLKTKLPSYLKNQFASVLEANRD